MNLYIFDKDGTIIFAPPGHIPSVPSDQRLLPGVAEKCQALLEDGHTLAIASNQGGVAYGFLTQWQADALVRHAAGLIGATFYEFCPFHPEGMLLQYRRDAWCRKPKPGMIETLLERTGTAPEDAIFVGNEITDQAAADAAAVEFVWASDFF